MTADEIRKNYQGDKPVFDPADIGSVYLAQLEIQAEVAAQLAEANALKREELRLRNWSSIK